MIKNIINIFRIEELKKKVLVTLGLLLVYRIGWHVPLPGVSMQDLLEAFEKSKSLPGYELIGLINVLSAGGLLSFGLFSLGIMPYISSSIIFSLLTKVVPSLERLAKEGASGQKKINQWTRWCTVPICIVQAAFVLRFLAPGAVEGIRVVDPVVYGSFWFKPMVLLALTAGGIFLMWVGEQITEHGVGNGISLLIMAGIVARMPEAFIQLFATTDKPQVEAVKMALLAVMFVFVVLVVVYITKGQRRIPVQYAKLTRGRRVYGGQRHYMPIRVNMASVMPVIFASSLLAFPTFLFGPTMLNIGFLHESFIRGGWTYSMLYIGLIFFFSFFWTALMFNPAEMSKNMKEYGAFVPGIRPGRRTADFLEKVMIRVTVAGAAFLAAIALFPQLLSSIMDLTGMMTSFLGGTSILIVVSVALDLVDKLNSHLVMRDYEGFMKGGGGSMRRR
ncbi:MAG: preprotein translocase subunit SecY [Planctomycetes bacterium]|nr:preprotein translocase subunit SecY [Planctomycetota bacterium]